MSSNFLDFHNSGCISSTPADFLILFFFFRSPSSFSSINSPGLMSCWLLSIFSVGLFCSLRSVSEQIFEMFFPLLKSFFLDGSFQFRPIIALPSFLIYSQWFQSWMPIYNKISDIVDLVLNVFYLVFLVFISSFWDYICFCSLEIVGFR